MIDRTNERIGQLEIETKRLNDRRYAFYRMLRATDRLLWQLEEMNREGQKTLPDTFRHQLRSTLMDLPANCQASFREAKDVQGALDNIFEIQESLFRWRHPDWAGDDEDVERAS